MEKAILKLLSIMAKYIVAMDNNWSGYGKEIKTIKELNKIFSIYVDREVKRKIKIDNEL